MTAILVCKTKGGRVVGADRCWSSSTEVVTCGPKVIAVGAWWLGLAGVGGCDWEELANENPKDPTEIGKLVGICEAELLAIKGSEVRYGSCDGKRWRWGRVYSDMAIGSGGASALAAWDGLKGYEPDPIKRMRIALRATAKRNPTVAAPFDVFLI